MEGGVSTQELEEAIKKRLSAVHTEVRDISGTSLASSSILSNWQVDVVNHMKL